MIYIHKGHYSWQLEHISNLAEEYYGEVESFEKPSFQRPAAPSVTIQGIEFTHYFSTGIPIFGDRRGQGVSALLSAYIQKYFKTMQQKPLLRNGDEPISFEMMLDLWLAETTHDPIPALLRTKDHQWYYVVADSSVRNGQPRLKVTKIEESSIVFQNKVIPISSLAKQRIERLQTEIADIKTALAEITPSDKSHFDLGPYSRKIAPFIQHLG